MAVKYLYPKIAFQAHNGSGIICPVKGNLEDKIRKVHDDEVGIFSVEESQWECDYLTFGSEVKGEKIYYANI